MQILQYWKIIIEITFLWYFIYMALLFIKGTRTEQLLKGIITIVIIFIITQQFKLEAINWVLTRLFPISVIALLVIFQPELRRGLARLGQFGMFREDIEVIEEISKAAIDLANRRIGALIAIEREVGLKTYIETGVVIDSRVTRELIISILTPKSPLHDGAIIIRRDRLVAAGCVLPLAHDLKGLSKHIGTRHRAAAGLSEETDAVCIIVSEETGDISLAIGGRLTVNLEKDNLAASLKSIFYKKTLAKDVHLKFLSRLSPRITEKSG